MDDYFDPNEPDYEAFDAQDPVPPPLPSEFGQDRFDDAISEDLDGLLYLGALSKEVSIGSHRIVIRTLKAGEELACAQIVRDYDGGLASVRAHNIAKAAAAIESVDGRPIATPLGPGDTLKVVREKFDYISDNWYYPVIDILVIENMELLARQAAAIEEYRGKLQATRT